MLIANKNLTFTKKYHKDILTKPHKKKHYYCESVNVTGFHSVNGHSVMSSPDKTNRITFYLHLIEVRSKNISNSDIQKLKFLKIISKIKNKAKINNYISKKV